MGKKKEDPEVLALKLEVAAELGLLAKIEKEGWGALSAAESGKIGGLLAKMKIGSGYMATVAGQPAIRDTADDEEEAGRP
ncbi:Small acid-soluble spore protein,alpha/beta-type [Moorella glycerini]|uniref:Small, acid-soluble spore protein, alpha/beta type n=1 Tax=Neomoorella stamsii TaxID=1266720 RepID=A0A9X7P7G2_9FIRM|nr:MULTISPECIES: small, acid-soluble spore protein, alpha/beta type [Moorella]PRR77360.1 Small, acid-soluble spore protein, alpha/beta type [Moorella stamsii]CEP65993.1 Small acid-soluble spore protein,alpha/beta-type [Moorella glycerini]